MSTSSSRWSTGENDNKQKGVWETGPFEPRKVQQTPDASSRLNETWNDNGTIPSEERHDLNDADSTVSSFIRDDILSDEENIDEDTLLTADLAHIEQLLSQRLLSGYCLLEKACPACAVPLVKQPLLSDDRQLNTSTENDKVKIIHNRMSTPKRIETSDGKHHYISFSQGYCGNSVSERSHETEASQPSIEVRSVGTFELSQSSQASVSPIAGVPFCVYCEAHVVTCRAEVEIIQEMASTIDIRQSGQVFVGACAPKRPITSDLLELTRHQSDSFGKQKSVDPESNEWNQVEQSSTDMFTSSDPTPRKNGMCFSPDGSKSYSLSPRRYNRGTNRVPTIGTIKEDPSSCRTRSKSYSPQMKRKGVTEPFFFASYDDASRNGANDNYIQQPTEEMYTAFPSFFDESTHRVSVFEKRGEATTPIGYQQSRKNPEGRTLKPSGINAQTNVEKPKADPVSPVVVVVATEYSDGENVSAGEESMGKTLPIVRGTSPVIVKGRKRDPESSCSGDSVDPIIVIASLEQFTSTEQITNNKTIDTLEGCAIDPVQSTNQGILQQQQQRRVFANKQMKFPEVEIPATPTGMNFDEVSALAHTYDEGSPTHQFVNSRGDNLGAASMMNRNLPTGSIPQNNDVNAKVPEMMDFAMPDYETRRDIATKILGSKMMIGYTLREIQCPRCAMPMMNKNENDAAECVVCPALWRKAIRANKLEEERQKLVATMAMQQQVLRENFESEMNTVSKQRESLEEKVLLEKERRELETELRKEQMKQQAQLQNEMRRVTDQQAKLKIEQQRAQQHLKLENRMIGQEQSSYPQNGTTNANVLQGRIIQQENVFGQHPSNLVARESTTNRYTATRSLGETTLSSKPWATYCPPTRSESMLSPISQNAVADSATRINYSNGYQNEKLGFGTSTTLSVASSTHETEQNDSLSLPCDSIGTYSSKGYDVEKSERKLENELRAAIQARDNAEIEVRRLADEKKALDEASLASLEGQFILKQHEAQVALQNASDTLREIRSARDRMRTKEIKDSCSGNSEDDETDWTHHTTNRHSIQWGLLREDAPSVMANMILNKWSVLTDCCRGRECGNAVLLFDGSARQCVVCGGSGNGQDGLYRNEEADDEEEKSLFAQSEFKSLSISSNADIWKTKSLESVKTMSLQELSLDFDTKRNMVSKEIKERMISGWTLLDLTCPNCVMPMMTDEKGRNEICVVCGLVGRDISSNPSDAGSKEQRFSNRKKKSTNAISNNTRTISNKKLSKDKKSRSKNNECRRVDTMEQIVENELFTNASIPVVSALESYDTADDRSCKKNPPNPNPNPNPRAIVTNNELIQSVEGSDTISFLNTLRERFNKTFSGNDPPASEDLIASPKKKGLDPPNSPLFLIKSWFGNSHSLDPEDSTSVDPIAEGGILEDASIMDIHNGLSISSVTSLVDNSSLCMEAKETQEDIIHSETIMSSSEPNDTNTVAVESTISDLKPPMPSMANSTAGSERVPINIDFPKSVDKVQSRSIVGSELSPDDADSTAFDRLVSPLGNVSPSFQNFRQSLTLLPSKSFEQHQGGTNIHPGNSVAVESSSSESEVIPRPESVNESNFLKKSASSRNRSFSVDSSIGHSARNTVLHNTGKNFQSYNTDDSASTDDDECFSRGARKKRVSNRSRSKSNWKGLHPTASNNNDTERRITRKPSSTRSERSSVPSPSLASRENISRSRNSGLQKKFSKNRHSSYTRQDWPSDIHEQKSFEEENDGDNEKSIEYENDDPAQQTLYDDVDEDGSDCDVENSEDEQDDDSDFPPGDEANVEDEENDEGEHLLTLEIPRGFSVTSNDTRRSFSGAEEGRSTLKVDTSSANTGVRREPSPGMSVASLPVCLPSPSSYAASAAYGPSQKTSSRSFVSTNSQLENVRMEKDSKATVSATPETSETFHSPYSTTESNPFATVPQHTLYVTSSMTSSSPGSEANPLNLSVPRFRQRLIPETSDISRGSSRVVPLRLPPPAFTTGREADDENIGILSTHAIAGFNDNNRVIAHEPDDENIGILSTHAIAGFNDNNRVIDEGTSELPILIEHESFIDSHVLEESSHQDESLREEASPVTFIQQESDTLSKYMNSNDAMKSMSSTSIRSEMPSSKPDDEVVRRHIASPGLLPISVPTISRSSSSGTTPIIEERHLQTSYSYSSARIDEHNLTREKNLSKDAIIVLHNDDIVSRMGNKGSGGVGGGGCSSNNKQPKEIFIIREEFEEEFDALSHDNNDVQSVGSDTINGLLIRIETTKSQIENTKKDDSSSNNAVSQYRLRNLIENLVVAAEEMEKYDKL